MSKPTQAQIGAALDAYARKLTEIFDNRKELGLMPHDREAAMTAALTAAADGIKDTPCGFDEGYKYKEAECKDEIAATIIERCANVANDWNGYITNRAGLVAAIRALKDKP